jgi:multiple antibiotic resistance protein
MIAGRLATLQGIHMSIALAAFAKALFLVPITVLPIINPIAGAPIFLSMTGSMEDKVAFQLAKRIAVNCFFLLLGAFFFGSYVLNFFGISLPVVRLGGGLIVAMAAWQLLQDQGLDPLRSVAASHEGEWSEEELQKRSFYPISFPLTVGPGTIAAAIALGTQLPHHPVDFVVVGFASLLGVILTVTGIYLCYRFAGALLHRLGSIGTMVLLRLSAFLLLCIGMEIGWTGLAALIEDLRLH